MTGRIIEIINLDEQAVAEANPTEPILDEICAATVKRRGRPRGTGRKHPEKCAPKTFRYFSPLSQSLLSGIRLTGPELLQQTEAEIVEEALVRFARSLSNMNPELARKLKRAGR